MSVGYYQNPTRWMAVVNVLEENKLELPMELSKNLHLYEMALINFSISFDKNINGQSVAITCDGLRNNQSFMGMQRQLLYVIPGRITRRYEIIDNPIYLPIWRDWGILGSPKELVFHFYNQKNEEITPTGSRSHISICLRQYR